MRIAIRRLATALFLGFISAVAQAAPFGPDPTGLWFSPSEPGWGMSINQQGETMFIVLYTHDANQQPTWFVASAVRGTGAILSPGGEVHAGPLYRATAPPFGATFPPNAMTVAAVGTVSLWTGGSSPVRQLVVHYVINGVTTSKLVQLQTWGTNRIVAQGGYLGNATVSRFLNPSCPPEPDVPFTSFSIEPIAGERVRWAFGPGVVIQGLAGCEAEGEWFQDGQLARVTAPLRCGLTSAPTLGTIELSQIAVNGNGLIANFLVTRGTCFYSGRIAGARRYP